MDVPKSDGEEKFTSHPTTVKTASAAGLLDYLNIIMQIAVASR